MAERNPPAKALLHQRHYQEPWYARFLRDKAARICEREARARAQGRLQGVLEGVGLAAKLLSLPPVARINLLDAAYKTLEKEQDDHHQPG